MFTGIVREAGEIVEVRGSESGSTFRIRSAQLRPELQVGASISVDGVCLTVTSVADDTFEVDVTPESLRRSNLGRLLPGHAVNLEPSLRLSDFLGGHLVQGHVDGRGQVLSIREEGNSWVFAVSLPEAVRPYCAMKGSIALNGISLTISGLSSTAFEVTIIPHTFHLTNMGSLTVGDEVNLEADVISKYVESHVSRICSELAGRSGPASGSGAD